MSLQTDAVFVAALRSNSTLLSLLPKGDVWGTAITCPDADLDNTPVPYVIVTYDGMQNDGDSKDDSYEGDTDMVQVSIEITANTREELADIAELVRSTISGYFEEYYGDDSEDIYSLIPSSYNLKGGRVSWDATKPCFWQTLTYSCQTNP